MKTISGIHTIVLIALITFIIPNSSIFAFQSNGDSADKIALTLIQKSIELKETDVEKTLVLANSCEVILEQVSDKNLK